MWVRDDDGTIRTMPRRSRDRHELDGVVDKQTHTSGMRLFECMNSACVFLQWSELDGHTVTKQNATDAMKATPGIVVLGAKGVYDP